MKIVFDPERSGEINTNFVQRQSSSPFSIRTIQKHLVHSAVYDPEAYDPKAFDPKAFDSKAYDTSIHREAFDPFRSHRKLRRRSSSPNLFVQIAQWLDCRCLCNVRQRVGATQHEPQHEPQHFAPKSSSSHSSSNDSCWCHSSVSPPAV